MRATNWTKIIAVTALSLFILNLFSCVTSGAKPEAKNEVKSEVKHEVSAISQQRYVDTVPSEGSFQLAQKGELATIYVDSGDWAGVIRAAGDLQADVNRVTGQTPKIVNKETDLVKNTVIIGTIGKSKLIDQLAKDKKIDTTQIAGKWESFVIAVVPKALPGVENALVIAGSDKRGTIFGIYDLSEQIGVSPWYWWADVPAKHKDALFIKAGKYVQGPPTVKYRGIFINDEGWALGPWANEKFGGFNNKFYVHVFELLLRLKANHLWPGMWGKYFGEDPMNPKLADEYGIVMGSAHCEPLLFNNDPGAKKWNSDTMGKWNYATNKENICKVLDETVAARGQYENVYTVGLRGVHDTKMEADIDVKAQVALLEQVFKDQRDILTKYIKKDVTEIPQVFVPYKEVQDYLDSGLKVPDDVTIMWSDDNWGNIRRLPNPKDKPRAGGAGVYYHYDFHGGPRSYEWLNTSPISRTWEQMHLAYRYGADRIWIVNVGDIKPMEFPISFFLDYAWNPDKWPAERLPEYTKLWAEQQFGPEYAADIADVLDKYTKYNGRRKPELLLGTYSLVNYREAERAVAEYNEIAEKADKIYKAIPAEYKDAYYQLVLYPTVACANLNELYLALGKNRLYEKQGRAATGDMANKVKELYNKDAELTNYHNKVMANGKWNHIMDTTHIGYTSWNPPPKNIMPEVNNITLPNTADMGVAIEGSDSWWPMEKSEAILPEFDPFNQQKYYIEVFNRGQASFDYKIESGEPWLIVTPNQGKIDKEQRVWVSVDWQKAPAGKNKAAITITGPDSKQVKVDAPINNPASPKPEEVKGFVEGNGYVSIEAEHYARAVEATPIKWLRIPDLSRTLSGVTVVPVTAQSQKPGGDSPRLEYPMYLFNSGKVVVTVYVCPSQNFLNNGGLRYAISFDDETPQIINIHEKDIAVPDWKYPAGWNQMVTENVKITTSQHNIGKPGEHVLKFWMVDPGIVLQKIVVNTGGVKPSYLGPPESYYKKP
ncbi:MAG: glycosyl hydrolase 115 family protein [Phycisphaerae bacterium]|jgi:hypothetical protein